MIALKGSGACRRMEGVDKPGLGKGPSGDPAADQRTVPLG